jgi:hypothetical protein
MSTEQKELLVEVDSVNIPLFIFHGESTDMESNLAFSVDDKGIRTLLTSEDKAKEILFNCVAQTKEEQEFLKKIQTDNELENALVEIELNFEEKPFIKNFRYNLSLLFMGYSDEGKPQFKVIQDTITGDFKKTSKILSNSKITNNQLNLF